MPLIMPPVTQDQAQRVRHAIAGTALQGAVQAVERFERDISNPIARELLALGIWSTASANSANCARKLSHFSTTTNH
jgi:hypothetical protein